MPTAAGEMPGGGGFRTARGDPRRPRLALFPQFFVPPDQPPHRRVRRAAWKTRLRPLAHGRWTHVSARSAGRTSSSSAACRAGRTAAGIADGGGVRGGGGCWRAVHCDLLHISAGTIHATPPGQDDENPLRRTTAATSHMAARVKGRSPFPVTGGGAESTPSALPRRSVRSGRADLWAMCRSGCRPGISPTRARREGGHRGARLHPLATAVSPAPLRSLVSELEQAQREGKPYLPFEQMTQLLRTIPATPTAASTGFAGEEEAAGAGGGGGCAGMDVRRHRRPAAGHAVILAEQSGELGGILNFAGEDEVQGRPDRARPQPGGGSCAGAARRCGSTRRFPRTARGAAPRRGWWRPSAPPRPRPPFRGSPGATWRRPRSFTARGGNCPKNAVGPGRRPRGLRDGGAPGGAGRWR